MPPNPPVARIIPHVIVSPSATVRTNGSVASLRATEQNSSPFGMTGIMDSTDRMSLPFMPPTIVTGLKNQYGQRIIEAVVWLPSGIEFENLSLTVADDMKHLKVHVLMDPILANGWALHSDLVPRGHELSHAERNMHVRVHHWNTVIDEMKTVEGLLPRFVAEVELPEEVCSKKFVYNAAKETEWGAKVVIVDMLVEDSKLPAQGTKRKFDLVTLDM